MIELLTGIGIAAFRLTAEMAPYLLFGIIAAGLLHVLLPVDWASRNLGGSGIKPVIKAALIGIPLPLCSCSTLPIAALLKKQGASNGAVVSFLVTTPTSGVDSIFATYSLMGGIFTVARVISSFFIGITVGIVETFTKTEDFEKPAENFSQTTVSLNKLSLKEKVVSSFSYGFGELLGSMAKSLAIGLILGGAITYLMPADFLEEYLGYGIVSYVAAAAFGVPLYVCATGSIPMAASLLSKGLSPGAALVFLIAGPAVNAAALPVIAKILGKRTTTLFVAVLIIGAITAGFIFDKFLGFFPDFLTAVSIPCEHDSIGYFKTVSALVLGGIIAYHIVSPYTERLFVEKKKAKEMLTIKIEDMTCNHCANKVESAIKALEGIESVRIDLSNKLVYVNHKDSLTSQDVIKAISDADYSPKIE